MTRVPKSLHRDLVKVAEKEGVSLNSLVNMALSRSVGRTRATSTVDDMAAIPHPVWAGLSNAAFRTLIAAGLEIEANEVNEKMFASWIEVEMAQVDASLKTDHRKDALVHLDKCQRALEISGKISPLMATYATALELLKEQIKYGTQLREGIIEHQVLRTRISQQVQTSSKTQLRAITNKFELDYERMREIERLSQEPREKYDEILLLED